MYACPSCVLWLFPEGRDRRPRGPGIGAAAAAPRVSGQAPRAGRSRRVIAARPPRHVGREAAALGPRRRGKGGGSACSPLSLLRLLPARSRSPGAARGGSRGRIASGRAERPLTSPGRARPLPLHCPGQGGSHRALDQPWVQHRGKRLCGRSIPGGRLLGLERSESLPTLWDGELQALLPVSSSVQTSVRADRQTSQTL